MGHDLLVLTGDKPRHKYFAIQLLKKFDNSKVIIEHHKPIAWVKNEEQITPLIRKHSEDFEKTEKKWFKDEIYKYNGLLKKRTLKIIEAGTINNEVEYIKRLNPKLIAVHSTSIIKEELINSFPRRIINLHAGLSPYYRGSGTNLFPFYNKELQYVGMTVHYLDVGVDSGDIIIQGKPDFEGNDNTHTIGCKNLIFGTQLMADTIYKYFKEGELKSVKQDLSKGKQYFKKDFTEEVIKKVYDNIKEGMVRKYISSF